MDTRPDDHPLLLDLATTGQNISEYKKTLKEFTAPLMKSEKLQVAFQAATPSTIHQILENLKTISFYTADEYKDIAIFLLVTILCFPSNHLTVAQIMWEHPILIESLESLSSETPYHDIIASFLSEYNPPHCGINLSGSAAFLS